MSKWVEKTLARTEVAFTKVKNAGFNDVPWNNKRVVAPHLESLARRGTLLGRHTLNFVKFYRKIKLFYRIGFTARASASPAGPPL